MTEQGLFDPRFVINAGYKNFHQELTTHLENCDSFDMSVAFIRYSGLQLILDTLQEIKKANKPGRILTSTYLNSTEPKALKRLGEFSNIQTRVFVPTRDRGFHAKGYLFRYGDQYVTIIGSANITQSALKSNVEWGVCNRSLDTDSFALDILREFNSQWSDEHTKDLSESFLREYLAYFSRTGGSRNAESPFIFDENPEIHESSKAVTRVRPNKMQTEAIVKLDRLRKQQEDRALAIAATGSGKTYLSVFDILQYRPRRLLFIVHREDILRRAMQSFEEIIDLSKVKIGLFTGTLKEMDADYLFATIQSLQKHYREFAPGYFDYIVVDEAHHASSPSYQNVLHWFNPQFLLGLTATPERSDDGDIYSVFGNNVAVEIRLRQALEWELVAPFHYFGITDFEGINYAGVDIDDTAAVAKLLMVSRRVDYIVEKMKFYGHDGVKRKALGFCTNIEHARFMTVEFNRRGIPAIALTGEDEIQTRIDTMERLENVSDPSEVIFTVDIFNEGIDIPSINTILMLRPTESAIIFVQQLGRGLRRTTDKEFVTVLDFIGNHRKSFLMAIALMGSRHFDRDDLKVAVKADFADIPGCSHIHMDRIPKEQILAQLEQEKFFSLKYLRQEYLDFKHSIGNKIPALVDFLKVDSAVDPVKFCTYSGTWLEFVAQMEKTGDAATLTNNSRLRSILRFYTDLLPCKRVYEFVIARLALSEGGVSRERAFSELTKHLSSPRHEVIIHSFNFLAGKYLDTSEVKKYKEVLFSLDSDILTPAPLANELFNNELHQSWILDLLNYGILRYEIEFGSVDYGVPHLKLWEQYTMRDLALLSNATRTHSSFRGQGLLTDNEHLYIFVDLHKEVDIREEINYKDRFLSRTHFQWETPNSTSPETDQGMRIINHFQNGQGTYLFARKFREIEGVSQPYTYFGKVIYLEHDPKLKRPMRIYYALENEVPEELYYEITTKVD
jgi:superfamily II DNA or RNA helicase/HKD family nuclease